VPGPLRMHSNYTRGPVYFVWIMPQQVGAVFVPFSDDRAIAEDQAMMRRIVSIVNRMRAHSLLSAYRLSSLNGTKHGSTCLWHYPYGNTPDLWYS